MIVVLLFFAFPAFAEAPQEGREGVVLRLSGSIEGETNLILDSILVNLSFDCGQECRQGFFIPLRDIFGKDFQLPSWPESVSFIYPPNICGRYSYDARVFYPDNRTAEIEVHFFRIRKKK